MTNTGNMAQLTTQKLTQEAFAAYGDVIETEGAHSFKINNGTTTRFHDLADVQLLGDEARALISIFRGEEFTFPVTIPMMERHPLGSQAFVPLSDHPFLVVVAEDREGKPTNPRAFLVQSHQGVNFYANTWHATLTSLEGVSDFLVVDRGGEGNNLEEYFFEQAFQVLS